MRNQSLVVSIGVLVGLFALGAKGCIIGDDLPEVTVTTDAVEYQIGDQGVLTVSNESDETVYLPGCSIHTVEKLLKDGTWEDRGSSVVCKWEGYAVPVPAGEQIRRTLDLWHETGTWRARVTVSFGCEPDLPISSANCKDSEEIYTLPFEIVPKAEPSCEGWMAEYSEEVDRISACTDASECEEVKGTSCGCTRNLVANKNIDRGDFEQLQKEMNAAGCGIITICDCPQADGFVCNDGRCAWNYI